jgi:ATP-binding cassette subfamily B protein
LFEAQEGVVLVDDVPTRDLSLATLRSEIGYVPQESLLFSETVGANIGYGVSAGDNDRGAPDAGNELQPGAALSEAPSTWSHEVIDATEIAQLTETISALPDAYATRLGERGINLSGGQKQRTALARALARRPRIVLLDDALSAVDTHTEAAILAGLRGALAGRTAIIASHRVSTVRDADHILVLADGRVVEQGRHDDLVAQGGRYAQLLQRQQLLDDIESTAETAA